MKLTRTTPGYTRRSAGNLFYNKDSLIDMDIYEDFTGPCERVENFLETNDKQQIVVVSSYYRLIKQAMIICFEKGYTISTIKYSSYSRCVLIMMKKNTYN